MIKRQKPIKRTPLKRRQTPIRKVSDKRQDQLEEYNTIHRPDFLATHKKCEICGVIKDFEINGSGPLHSDIRWWPLTCPKTAVEIHHTEGREGSLLNKVETFMASCNSRGGRQNGHTWIKEHPAAALELQLIRRRNT